MSTPEWSSLRSFAQRCDPLYLNLIALDLASHSVSFMLVRSVLSLILAERSPQPGPGAMPGTSGASTSMSRPLQCITILIIIIAIIFITLMVILLSLISIITVINAIPSSCRHFCCDTNRRGCVKERGMVLVVPHPVIVTISENRDHIRVLLYSYYTTITGWGVHLNPKP